MADRHARSSPSRSSGRQSTASVSTNVSDTTDATENEKRSEQDTDTDPARVVKAQQIREACRLGDLAGLQALAVSDGGFLRDDLRQMAWPVLLGLPVDEDGQVDLAAAAAKAGMADEKPDVWQQLPAHPDEEQVELDVNRAFVYYPSHASPAEESRRRRALSDLIVEVLRRQPFLCYFQGFHDICQVLLLVLPPPLRTPAVLRLALLRIRDFMLPTIDAAVQQLLLLPDILRLADPPLWAHLRLAQVPRPFFALTGTLTMYAHDLRSLAAIARVFDVLLARTPAFSLYLFAAIACAHRAALFATPADEPEMLHHILSRLPADGLDDPETLNGADRQDDPSRHTDRLDRLIADAVRLADRYPPNTLPSWRTVSAASVLKTAQDGPTAAAQTMADGARLFHVHVKDIARVERRRQQRARVQALVRQYRGPLRVVGLTVLVGLAAVWLRRSGGNPMAVVASTLTRLGVRFT